MRIIWLKPTKGYVSIGRYLIADILRKYGFNIEVIECSGVRLFKILPKLLKSDFDALIGTTHLGLAIGGLIKLVRCKPFIADFVDRFDLLSAMYPPIFQPIVKLIVLMEKFSLKMADAVIVIPMRDYEELVKKRSMVFKTNLCTDLDRFFNVDKKIIERAKNLLIERGINLNKPKIVYLGSFNPVYNLELLLKAMKELRDFQLILIGGGEMETELKKLKDNLNLRNVFFLGFQPHELVPGILTLCDIGVTLAEVPRQLKIYEYLASGLNVVVPKSVLKSEDSDFAEYCIGVDLSEECIARGIMEALRLDRPKNIENENLKKYNCRDVVKVYLSVLRSVLNESCSVKGGKD